MVFAQAVQQSAPTFVNWSINVYDLILLGASAALIYGRLVRIETEIAPIVRWWNQMVEQEHQIGRRWSDSAPKE